MPLTIRASCLTCLTVDLGVEDVILHVYEPEDAAPAYYEFVCPICQRTNEKQAPEHIVQLLTIAEVAVVVHDVPPEALEEHVGEVISHDDVIDFSLALATDEWMTELLGDPNV
jgi:hypothetical protein